MRYWQRPSWPLRSHFARSLSTRLYVGAGAGANILQDEAVKSITSNGPRTWARGPTTALASVRRSSAASATASATACGSSCRAWASTTRSTTSRRAARCPVRRLAVTSISLACLPTALFDIPINAPVVPYVGGGIGYLHNSSTMRTCMARSNSCAARVRTDNAGYQAIVGLSFPVYSLLPGLSFTAEYRFMGEIGQRAYKDQYFASAHCDGPKPVDPGTTSTTASCSASGMPSNTAPPPPVVPVVAPAPVTPARTYLVFFDWDRADLTDRARQIIAEAASASTRVQTTRIEVQATPTAPAPRPTTRSCRCAAPRRSPPSWSASAWPARRSTSRPSATRVRWCPRPPASANRRTAASRVILR